MQRTISNNDMNDLAQGPPVLDDITRKFLMEAFKVLRQRDAIVITGSCVVALTLENRNLPSFLPADIDVFVKQNLQLDGEIFDRYFLYFHILVPLWTKGIHTQPRDIAVKASNFKKYSNCKINILQIMEIALCQDGEDVAINRPKIQLIVVADDSSIPQELPLLYLTPFERKVVTSFDIDIVQGAYNPNSGLIKFAYNDTKQNILEMQFWYICDPDRPNRLSSALERIKKYTDRTFTFKGFRDINQPHLAIFLTKYRLSEPQSFLLDTDSNKGQNGLH